MSEVRPTGTPTGQAQVAADGTSAAPEPTAPTAWGGWVRFGAMIMILLGTVQAISGLISLVDPDYYAVAPSGLAVTVSYSAWGWVHLVVGLVALVAGIGLFGGALWARILGVAVALVSAIVNFAFLAAYPLWCLTMISFDILIVYAISVHGSEVRDHH